LITFLKNTVSNTIQYNTIQFEVKNANGTAVTVKSAVGKRRKTDESWVESEMISDIVYKE